MTLANLAALSLDAVQAAMAAPRVRRDTCTAEHHARIKADPGLLRVWTDPAGVQRCYDGDLYLRRCKGCGGTLATEVQP